MSQLIENFYVNTINRKVKTTYGYDYICNVEACNCRDTSGEIKCLIKEICTSCHNITHITPIKDYDGVNRPECQSWVHVSDNVIRSGNTIITKLNENPLKSITFSKSIQTTIEKITKCLNRRILWRHHKDGTLSTYNQKWYYCIVPESPLIAYYQLEPKYFENIIHTDKNNIFVKTSKFSMNIVIPNNYCITDYVDKIIFTLRYLVGLENNLNLPLISGITDNGDTLLHLAIILGRPVSTVIEIMLSDSSLINIKNKDGYTPFEIARINKYHSYLRIVKYSPEEILKQDEQGNTILHYANKLSDIEIRYILKMAPELLEIKNNNGETVLEVDAIKNSYKYNILYVNKEI
jgi:hypothetical protein